MRPAVGLALAVLAGAVAAHVRLHHPSTKQKLSWQNEQSIGIVINAAGSDDVADGSHFTALRNAIDAWNDVAGSTARLVENTSPTQQARTDWQSGIHLILFDEDDSSGYFPPGSGTVALTPVSYDSGGRIVDADVLFNGSGYSFTTSGVAGRFDVQTVAAHEIGHLLGLDHTGWAGGTMYPYVAPGLTTQRSLSLDEVRGMRDAYPAQGFATISGVVRRASDSSAVAGAHVVARDASGRTAAAALANGTGTFTLEGLEPGSYTVCANPLDQPVSNANLTSGHSVATDFEAAIGATLSLDEGEAEAYGVFLVDDDVALALGRNSDTLPLRCEIGATTLHSLRGSGLGASCSLQASDPTIDVTPTLWSGTTQVFFNVAVPAGATPGHADLQVIDATGSTAILPAAIELVAPDPTLALVVPPLGDVLGGTPIAISGTGFRAGARVVIGERIYADGEIGGCVVVDPGTITLVTSSTPAGAYDVVVIDATGSEGRAAGAFEFVSIPQIDRVFPIAGADVGGTEVVITGSGFTDPMLVTIDGVLQGSVAVESSTLVRVTTSAGIAGGPYVLELVNAQSQVASAAFTYVAQFDPQVGTLTPSSGSTAGGDVVTIEGANFAAGSTVVFGVDPDTGLGGSAAAAVTWLDGQTLEVTTPAHSQGDVAVMVQDGATGQAYVLDLGFRYVRAASPGGGGGGCHAVPVDDVQPGSRALAGAWWLVAALFLLHQRARLQRERALAAARRIRI